MTQTWRITNWADIEELVGFLVENGAETGTPITLATEDDGALSVRSDGTGEWVRVTTGGQVKTGSDA